MRIGYYGYHILNNRTKKRYLFDLRQFLKAFCANAPISLKNRIKHYDEHLYLFHSIDDLLLLIKTRSHEVIKRINGEHLQVSEIYDLLGNKEYLGFASFAYLREHHLGFASSSLAPKFTVFSYFVNQIFQVLGWHDYEFEAEAFLHQATKEEALSLPFLGRTVIQMAKAHSFTDDFMGILGASVADTQDIASFEITIRPKRKCNIEHAVKRFISTVPEDGLSKMIVRAKGDIEGSLADLYLVGKGAIADIIESKNDAVISTAFNSKMAANRLLQEKVEEFVKNDRFKKADLNDLPNFRNPNPWSSSVSDL